MRQAFTDIMKELGSESDSGEIFDNVLKVLESFQQDKNIAYDKDGYHIYLMREDYTERMKNEKKYWMSVSPR